MTENKKPQTSLPIRPSNWLATGVFLLLLAVFGLASVLDFLKPIAQALTGFYFLLTEILFWYASSNEAVLAIAAVVFALPIAVKILDLIYGQSPPKFVSAIQSVFLIFISFLALIAVCYLAAFSLMTERRYLKFVLIGAVVISETIRRVDKNREVKRSEPAISEIPLAVILTFVFIYLFLGLVAGHLATPVVHYASAFMAKTSAYNPILYRLIAAFVFVLPYCAWLPKLIRQSEPRRKSLPALLTVAPFLMIIFPTPIAIYGAGAIGAMILIYAMSRAGHLAIRPLAFDPRIVFARTLMIALLFFNAMSVHYFAVMWNCANAGQNQDSMRLISREAGAFDFAAENGQVLASLREPRRLIAIDPLSGTQRTILDTRELGAGTGHVLSTVEPETLLPIKGGRFLLLTAVSDDEEQNRVAVIDGDGQFEGYVEDLPQTSISDFVTDSSGRIYVSTEFDDQVFVLDPETLNVLRAYQWHGAETNKIIAAGSIDRLFSLGLWRDPAIRAMDMTTGRETAHRVIGTRSWDMAYDPVGNRLYVPRFLSGKLLILDAADLSLLTAWNVGFSARPVAVDPQKRLLYTATMYGGRLLAFNLDTGKKVFERKIGGHIKSIRIDPATRKAYTGCNCGIYEIDLP
jgi:DNA-binding beta-propeller fold protein YncE